MKSPCRNVEYAFKNVCSLFLRSFFLVRNYFFLMKEFVNNTASLWFLLFGRTKTVTCQTFAGLKMPFDAWELSCHL